MHLYCLGVREGDGVCSGTKESEGCQRDGERESEREIQRGGGEAVIHLS